MPQAKIGVIGGTGLYEIEGMTEIEEVTPRTSFGDPSDAIIIGNLEGVRIAFLPRHGRGHRMPVSRSELKGSMPQPGYINRLNYLWQIR